MHLRTFPEVPSDWKDEALAAKWEKIRQVRRVVTGALEIERAEKRIGSSRQAAPDISVAEEYAESLSGIDLAEIRITSDAKLSIGTPSGDGFTLDDVPGVSVVPGLAGGKKCERCWQVLPEVGNNADYPHICNRCADAVANLPAATE